MRSRRRSNTSSRWTAVARSAMSGAYNRAVSSEELLRRYAELAVRVGANVGEGQDVIVAAHVEQAPFARALAAAAYEAGARYFTVFYADQYVKRQLILHGADETLEWTPPWQLPLHVLVGIEDREVA